MEKSFNPRLYWEDRLTNNPGITGVGYTSLGEGYNRWLYRVRSKIFFRLLRSRRDWASASVLDVGSGTGFYINLWKRLGAGNIAGSDLTATATSRLKSQFPECQFDQVDIGGSVPDNWKGSFDAVSAFDIFFHIVEDFRYRQAIENVASVLQPGGLFVFSDIFLHGPTRRSVHMVSRSLRDVDVMLNQSGFETVARVPMFVLLNQPLDTSGRVHPFLWEMFVHVVRIFNFVGTIAGAILYPVELLLTRVCRESPTTEILLCRKR